MSTKGSDVPGWTVAAFWIFVISICVGSCNAKGGQCVNCTPSRSSLNR